MAVPEQVKALRQQVLAQRGEKLDDIEFTFIKGMWSRLGEATLMNRIKSHPDVGERWYPDLLKQIREQSAEEERRVKKADTGMNRNGIVTAPAVAAH